MANEKRSSCAFDGVIANLKKLNGKKIASYLLGYLDGAFLRPDSRARAPRQRTSSRRRRKEA